MQDKVVTSTDQVTVEWLTSVLANSGALTGGAVATFDIDTGRGNWSTSASLNVRYVDGSRGLLPRRLFLKIVNVDLEDEVFGPSAELKSHWPAAISALYARHPQAIIERTRDDNGFTLIHGDAGHNNILVPRNGDRPIYIIDRQPFNWSLTTWLGVYDLAYAIVLDWEVETRRRLEMPVLRHYHDQLVKKGVNGYSWDRLFDDYRLSVAMGVYIATEYCRGGVNERRIPIWLPMLQRSLTACDDLDCSQLW